MKEPGLRDEGGVGKRDGGTRGLTLCENAFACEPATANWYWLYVGFIAPGGDVKDALLFPEGATGAAYVLNDAGVTVPPP